MNTEQPIDTVETTSELIPSLRKRRIDWKSFLVGALATFTLFGLGAGVFAHRVKNGSWMANRISKTLNLSTEQKARLRIIWSEARMDVKANRAKMKKLRAKAVLLMKQNSPNKVAMDGIVSDFFDNAKRIALSKTAYVLRAHNVLTPKQRARVHNKMEKIHKFMKKRHKKRHHSGFVPKILQ